MSRALPHILLLTFLAVAVLASCRGKHAPPPGFVPPGDLMGYALLIVRIEDGAWVQQSPMAEIERLHAIEELPWLLVQASGKEGSAALDLVESLGFELECKDGDACGLGEGQERPGARTNAVRLARIMRDAFSEKKSPAHDSWDNTFVNLVGSLESAGRSDDGLLCHALFPSPVHEQWLVGWIPCREPEYVMVLRGPGVEAKALKIVDFLDL